MLRAAIACAACFASAGDVSSAENAGKTQREMVFQLLDRDGNGSLNADEFVHGTVGRAAETKRKEFAKWDLNSDESVDFVEFRKRGNKQPDPKARAEYFKTLDRDSDGALTLDEYLSQRSAAEVASARMTFFSHDTNEDGQLNLEELLASTQGIRVSPRNQFKQRDINDDGVLDEDEFVRPSLGKPYENAVRQNFARFDLNEDAGLSLSEFALLPTQKPTTEALFRGLDQNEDGGLTLHEFLALHPEAKRQRGRIEFFARDSNEDDMLDFEEYTSKKSDQPVSSQNQFKQRDTDGDGALTIDEFTRPNANTKFFKTAQSNSRLFDIDGDGFLSLNEFELTPGQHPAEEALFNASDADNDGQLTLKELTRFTPTGQARLVRELFEQSDEDGDGRLTNREYEAHARAVLWAGRKKRFWEASTDAVFWIAIVLDAIALAYITYCATAIIRTRRHPRIQALIRASGSAPSEPSSATTPEHATSPSRPGTPESIDDFQIE